MKKILIIGSYGASNIGDEAILTMILKNLPPKTEKYVLSGNPAKTTQTYQVKAALHLPFGLRSFFSFQWIQSFLFIKKCNLVLLGGGGLFTDRFSLKAILLWTWHVFWLKLFHKKIILLANSIGPLQTKLGLKLTQWSLKQCYDITVRDQISLDLAQKILPSQNIKLYSDPAFLFYESTKKFKKDPSLVAISLCDFDINFNEIKKFIKYLSKKYKVLLIAMDDSDITLLQKFSLENTLIIQPQNFTELLEILAKCEIAFGMRLHFLIAAIISLCKVSGIAYSSKVAGIFKKTKIPFINSSKYNFENLKTIFCKANLAQNLDNEYQQAKTMFQNINY